VFSCLDHELEKALSEAVIVSALRTPIGTARKGTLRDTSAFDLAHHVVSEAAVDLDATKVDDVILGEGLYGGGVLARHAAITAGLGGGGCSPGHPVAATGARMLVTLVHELRRRGGGIGVAAVCAGGGMGSATVIEVPAP